MIPPHKSILCTSLSNAPGRPMTPQFHIQRIALRAVRPPEELDPQQQDKSRRLLLSSLDLNLSGGDEDYEKVAALLMYMNLWHLFSPSTECSSRSSFSSLK